MAAASRGSVDEEEATPLLGSRTSTAAATTTTVEDLDARFKRWLDYVARLAKRGKGDRVETTASLLVSVFEKEPEDAQWSVASPLVGTGKVDWDGLISEPAFQE